MYFKILQTVHHPPTNRCLVVGGLAKTIVIVIQSLGLKRRGAVGLGSPSNFVHLLHTALPLGTVVNLNPVFKLKAVVGNLFHFLLCQFAQLTVPLARQKEFTLSGKF